MTELTTYRLVLRPAAVEAASSSPDPVLDRFLRIPGVVALGDRRFEFGAEDQHGVMRLAFETAAIDVAIPRPWVHEKGPRVFALVFMLAEWLQWEVYDPQIEDVLVKEVVLQGMVAMRQAQREKELRNGPGSDPDSS